jgi:hypothetical protein
MLLPHREVFNYAALSPVIKSPFVRLGIENERCSMVLI